MVLLSGIGLPELFEVLFHLLVTKLSDNVLQLVEFAVHVDVTVLVLVYVDLFGWTHFSSQVLADCFRVFDFLSDLLEVVLQFSQFLHLQFALFHVLIEQ